jgi:hypothetical protein
MGYPSFMKSKAFEALWGASTMTIDCLLLRMRLGQTIVPQSGLTQSR